MVVDSPTQEFAAKHARLVEILEARAVDGLVLSSAGALSWLLCGASVHVSLAGGAVLRALVHREGVELAVFGNEIERLCAEELPELMALDSLRFHECHWYEDIENVSPYLPKGIVSVLKEEDAGELLRRARASLLPGEVARYKTLSAEVAAAMTDVLSEAMPHWTERHLTAAVGYRLLSSGADPLVLLASGESRANHRHPLPSALPIGRRAMAVASARRGGLIAHVTRWVQFGESTQAEKSAEQSLLEVEADAMDSLVPGTSFKSVLQTLMDSYPSRGFVNDEWMRHHQGGAAGYVGRDPRLGPGVSDLVQRAQPFALNPSAFHNSSGVCVKVEDTVLITSSGAIEVLSEDQRWPSVQVRGRLRPLPLAR